jgi:TfoX/Sxy family transcriptional regulator of competence genes
MSYNEALAERIRKSFSGRTDVAEKAMMGGLTFMVNDKMCVGVVNDALMVRFDPNLQDQMLAKPGVRPMDFTGRPMSGYIFVEESAVESDESLRFWLELAIAFNPKAKASKRK